MRKVVMFGVGSHVRNEMDSRTVKQYVDYFVDNSPYQQGKLCLSKPIRHPDSLLNEEKESILIIIGSIIYKAEIALQLANMGFVEGKHFIGPLDLLSSCNLLGRRLYAKLDWDAPQNEAQRNRVETDEYFRGRLLILSSLADFSKFDTVVDLGAANERVREFLPQRIRYVPVDKLRYSADTFICDLNSDFPDAELVNYEPEKTLFISAGNINYISDWKQYLFRVAQNSSCLLLAKSYALGRLPNFIAKSSYTFAHQIIIEMQKLGFVLTAALDYRLIVECLKFERRIE